MSAGSGIIRSEQLTGSEKIAYFAFGSAIAVYLAILFGGVWTPDCDINEFLANFNQFVIKERHFIVGFTKATPMFILAFEGAFTLAYLYAITAFRHPFAGKEYGDAKWGDARSFTRDFGNHDDKWNVEVKFGDAQAPKEPVIVNTHNYWLAEGVYLSIDNKKTSNLNILIVGPPGTGKSFRLVRPFLSQLAGSFLVTDPKGELYQQTAQYMQDNGYESLVLNIESEDSMANSIHFNPFRYLANESSILSLSQILFKATTDPTQDSGGDAFFEQSAETLMTDIFYLMYYTYPDDMKDWTHFVELLESTAVKADPKTHAIDLTDEKGIYNRFKTANEKWHEGVFTHGVKQEEHLKGWVDVEKFYTGAQETTSSIVASLDAHCRYMKLDCVKKLLSNDDIRITENFGYCKKTRKSPTGKRVLYIVTSENSRYYDWITSMVYSLFFEELYHVTGTDEKLHQTLPEHLTFLMDEFANVTLPDSFVEKLSTMRSRGMSAVVIVQNLHQLKQKFPKNDLDKGLMANMAVTEILGGPDVESCEQLSKLFGDTTIHKQTTGESSGGQGSHSTNEDVLKMPLFSPQQMHDMQKDGPCAIAVTGANPLFEPKVQFQNSPLLPLLTRKKHYVIKETNFEFPKYDPNKKHCEQIPEIYFDKAADEFLAECEENDIKVIKVTSEDMDALDDYLNANNTLEGHNESTEQFWRMVHENTDRAKREAEENRLDMAEYTDAEVLTVQKLKNRGFSVLHIKALTPLIKQGKKTEELLEYFNPALSVIETKEFVDRLIKSHNNA